MPGIGAGRRVDDGQHVRLVHRQPVLAEGGSQLPRRDEWLERRHWIATRPAQPSPLEQRADTHPRRGSAAGVNGVEDGVPPVEAGLEPQRPRQLRQRLVGAGGVAGKGGGLDGGPKASLGGGAGSSKSQRSSRSFVTSLIGPCGTWRDEVGAPS